MDREQIRYMKGRLEAASSMAKGRLNLPKTLAPITAEERDPLLAKIGLVYAGYGSIFSAEAYAYNRKVKEDIDSKRREIDQITNESLDMLFLYDSKEALDKLNEALEKLSKINYEES